MKTNINWYPGHMAKTKRQIIEDLKLIDVVIEILDARIPISSRNPDIGEYTKNKKKLIILNKYDLADENQNRKWIEYFKANGIEAVLVNSNTGEGINKAIEKIEEVYNSGKKQYDEKGRIGKSIRVMVLGIPNVGKSSFINRISKKTVATVGNKPGVTRQKQWIRINQNIELLDTPGILWPKFESEEVALNLSYTGSIKDEVIEIIEVSFNLIRFLLNKYMDKLLNRYKLNTNEIDEILDLDIEENEKIYEIMKLIGKKRGALISGGEVDIEKVSRIILDDFRSGKIGRITLEEVKN
jgi:ribosome biogenesis GTPase A